MTMSQRSLETLIDLVENKLSCLEVFDRDDARELANLEHCLKELRGLSGLDPEDAATIVAFKQGRRGRRRATV